MQNGDQDNEIYLQRPLYCTECVFHCVSILIEKHRVKNWNIALICTDFHTWSNNNNKNTKGAVYRAHSQVTLAFQYTRESPAKNRRLPTDEFVSNPLHDNKGEPKRHPSMRLSLWDSSMWTVHLINVGEELLGCRTKGPANGYMLVPLTLFNGWETKAASLQPLWARDTPTRSTQHWNHWAKSRGGCL